MRVLEKQKNIEKIENNPRPRDILFFRNFYFLSETPQEGGSYVYTHAGTCDSIYMSGKPWMSVRARKKDEKIVEEGIWGKRKDGKTMRSPCNGSFLVIVFVLGENLTFLMFSIHMYMSIYIYE